MITSNLSKIREKSGFVRTIRQCRPDKRFDLTRYKNIGFYNKNRSFRYFSYYDETAEEYLLASFGTHIRDIYRRLTIPQARSDFFLVASLLIEGGVSADVCSTCTAPILPLLQDPEKLHVVHDQSGYHKKFFYAPPNHPVVRAYFEYLIQKVEANGDRAALSYDEFSSQPVFDTFLTQFLTQHPATSDRVMIIGADDYNSVIRNEVFEELHEESEVRFRKASIRGVVDHSVAFSAPGCNRIIARQDGAFYKAPSNPVIVGYNRHPTISRDAIRPIALPELELYELNDIVVSGHACLWKGNTFLRQEAYLSFVAERETDEGFWKSPEERLPSRIIEDEVIVAFGAGYGCYGHYLVDELPRLALAKMSLGERFFGKRILMPSQTPKWGLDIMKFFLDISDDMFLFFDHSSELISLRKAIIPTYAHKDYNFHPFVREFYAFCKNDNPDRVPFRRICLSRKSWERTKSNQRVFLDQDFFEEVARSRGFEIVQPETLSIQEQMNLLRETRCQVGEHGSAQHASVYNPHGSTVGTINPLTEIQCNIGRLYGDKNVITFHDHETIDESRNTLFTISHGKILEFFDAVEREDAQRTYRHRNLISEFDMLRR